MNYISFLTRFVPKKGVIEKMKDLRVQRTYILLKNALFNLLAKKPFEEIKVNDICNDAMIHRTTFYHHFQDKYELLEFCIHDLEQELIEKIHKDSYTTTREFYTNLITSLLEYISEKKTVFKNVLKHNSENSLTEVFMNTCVHHITFILEKEESQGINHNLDVHVMSHFYAGGLISTLIWWISSNSNLSEKEICNSIVKLIFDSPHA